MEICHGLVGSLSDTSGEVTSPSASIAAPPQDDSVVHPVTYMWKWKMILILAVFSAKNTSHLLAVESHLYQAPLSK